MAVAVEAIAAKCVKAAGTDSKGATHDLGVVNLQDTAAGAAAAVTLC
jgi:hypothetical protein